MSNQHFTEYKSKLTFEAVLKSVLCGIAIGFGLCLVLSSIFWFIGIQKIWILIAATLGVTVVSAALFYLRFRPNDISSARRLDRLGLHERMITMVELNGEDSCIANLQREDAKATLNKLDKGSLKIKVATKIIVLATVFFVLGTAMFTVNVLAMLGILGYGDEVIEEIVGEEFAEYVTVTYEAGDGGTIDGDDVQDIVKGTDTVIVTAVADEGFMFKEWSDGVISPSRYEQKVNESITLTAVFIELEDEEGEEGQNGEGGDKDNMGEEGDSSSDEGGEEGAPPGQGEPNPNATAGGGQREPNNQIIDGKTYYKEVLEYYQELVSGQLEDNDNLTDEEIDLIKKYLGIV